MKQAMKRLNISRVDLATKFNTSVGYINQVLGGKNSISASFREKLSKHYTNLNVDWVMTGEGEMIFENKDLQIRSPEPGLLAGVLEPEPEYVVLPSGGMLESLFKRVADMENMLREQSDEIRALQMEVSALRGEVECATRKKD